MQSALENEHKRCQLTERWGMMPCVFGSKIPAESSSRRHELSPMSLTRWAPQRSHRLRQP